MFHYACNKIFDFQAVLKPRKGRAMQLQICTCKVCGNIFYSKTGKANFCQDKSTCRVAWSRQRQKERIAAEKMTVSVEVYALYQTVISIRPMCKDSLDYVLAAYGKGAFNAALVVASNCISYDALTGQDNTQRLVMSDYQLTLGETHE